MDGWNVNLLNKRVIQDPSMDIHNLSNLIFLFRDQNYYLKKMKKYCIKFNNNFNF